MNPLYRLIPRYLALLSAVALLLPSVHAKDEDADAESSEGSTARVQFSNPAKPGTLKFSLPWAEARITGTDGNEVVVTSSLDQKGKAEVDQEGFRRLDEDVTFELVEKDNVATIVIAGENLWSSHGAEFEIKVPRNTNLILHAQHGGDIEVEGVEGEIDINSMNGEIDLRDIVSSAVVNTMNGEISASFKRAPSKPVSLTSMNGEIDLRLPSDTKANLRMRTHNGSIRTNFPDKILQAKTEKTSRTAVAPSADGQPVVAGSNTEREMAREQARLERDLARAQEQVEKEMIRANAEAARIATQVRVNVNGEDVVVAIPPIPPISPIPPLPNFGGKSITGTLNGGGIDIKLTSMNGTITLRSTK